MRAAARAKPRGFLVADMPFHSYENPDQALTHATQLKEAGAKGVKLEGGQEVAPQIQAILQSGIPCVGTLGYASSASGRRRRLSHQGAQ